jgi:hypothetical protein
MEDKKYDTLFVVLAFLGPMGVVLLPSFAFLSKEEKECVVEGLFLFFFYFIITLILSFLSAVPFLGLAFSMLNSAILLLYVCVLFFLIYKKLTDIYFEIPFASFYAKRIISSGVFLGG